MNQLPKSVTLIEVGLRDGIQIETKLIPTEMKVQLISMLIAAGIRHIQVTSFVNPRITPQMADADELIRHLPTVNGVTYSGLALNEKGVERAAKSKISSIEVSISSSDTHSRRNAGISLEQGIIQGQNMTTMAKENGMQVCSSIQCAFGCAYEGTVPLERVLHIAQLFSDSGADRIGISDTTGMADPPAVKNLLTQLSILLKDKPISLHLHDTRGLGLVNVMTALECGVSIFDTSFGGMGGCPFVPGAAGNIATEDTAYLMQRLHIDTGIDIAKVADCTRHLENFFGKIFPARLPRVISP